MDRRTLLLVTLLSVVTVAVAKPHFEAAATHDHGHCMMDGIKIQHGDEFTTKMSGPCIVYICEHGGYHPIRFACEDQSGTCRPEGYIRTIGCSRQQCIKSNFNIGFRNLQEACQARDGSCVDIGGVWTHSCLTYRCIKVLLGTQEFPDLQLSSWGCPRNDQCIPANATTMDGCSIIKCEQRGQYYGLYPQKHGCRHDGSCHDVGSRWTVDCNTYTCHALDNPNGVTTLSVENVDAKCKDVHGSCHAPGDSFEFDIAGTVWPHCTCAVNGPTIDYSCHS
ncbi:uncharacterized protein LOC124134312 [Haliotis rufescens]|uniref:uncharacterized protein LOC124134312 n=1 Tax=Haliotis rufescens TaxID=6454 RepID=UPI00201F4C0F|nr:uncharacterized protein LOC124134312 [Haliotis rufescens]